MESNPRYLVFSVCYKSLFIHSFKDFPSIIACVHAKFLFLSCGLVPGCGRIEDIDDEMATAIFCPPVESEDPVDFYIASIVGGKPYQACGVLANASTLACQLTYLEEYTNYTATFVACRFPGNETSCGEAISTGFTTKLSREYSCNKTYRSGTMPPELYSISDLITKKGQSRYADINWTRNRLTAVK